MIVITGRDKGRRGNVVRCLPDGKVLVESVQRREEAPAAEPAGGTAAGGIVEKERPLDASNVMLYNPTTEKGDRVGYAQARRRPQGALLQVERRSRGSL